jgi:hypothetical protein
VRLLKIIEGPIRPWNERKESAGLNNMINITLISKGPVVESVEQLYDLQAVEGCEI